MQSSTLIFFFVCVCVREKSHSHLGNTHISSQDSLSIFVKGYAKFDGGRGWGRLNLNGGLDHSLKEMKDEKKRNEMAHF